jgi:tripartite-type tricarboxylate transporter receptor subunit TctC
MNVSLFKQLSFDFAKDFAPVSLLTSTPLILLVRSDFKATNMRDFIQFAKSSVDSFRIATSGPGSASDFAVKMLNQKAGITLSGVPYRGSMEGLADVLGGRIEGIFAPPSTALPQVNAGALRALGITSARRSEIAPEIPTMVESGLLGYELSIWNGLLVPTGTPTAIIDQLAAAARRAFESRPNKAKIVAQGADVSLLGPAEFRTYINEEIIRWAELAHATDMKPQ